MGPLYFAHTKLYFAHAKETLFAENKLNLHFVWEFASA